MNPRAVGPLLALTITLLGFGWLHLAHPSATSESAGIPEEDVAVIPPMPAALPPAVTAAEPAAAPATPAPSSDDTESSPPAATAAPQAAAAAARPVSFLRPAITARTPPGTQFRECADCPTMMVIPAGTFFMGTPDGEVGRTPNEGPRQRVAIAAFALAVTPITFNEFDACVAAGACAHRPGDQGWGRGTRPVVNVSWEDARAYIAWLSGPATGNYRLPTEAEWEYAARAGTTTPYWWGHQVGTDNANCRGCTGDVDLEQTAPVASFRPNAFGLHDMLGNVWQWVEDCGNAPLAGRPPMVAPC